MVRKLPLILLFLVSMLGAEEKTPDVGVDEKLGNAINLDLKFRDEAGQEVPLRTFFTGKTVILAPAYYECPRLCTFVYNALKKVMQASRSKGIEPGKDYAVISVSFNPDDTPELASKKGGMYRRTFEKPLIPGSWTFLTGSQENISALFDSIGYRYKADGSDFSHPAAIVLFTPEGRISRYLYGLEHNEESFRLSLVETSQGLIGGVSEKIVLLCFRFDPSKGKYTPYVMGFVRIASVLLVLSIGGLIFFLRKKERT